MRARLLARDSSVAIGDYPMDSHAVEDLTDPTRRDKGEGECWLAKFTPWYQIPYGVMVPKTIDGLMVTTAVSATHIGYGTLRMEPVRMSMGQAAGVAAYYSISYCVDPRYVYPPWIQDKVLDQHAYIAWYSDVTPDTRHFKAIHFIGARGMLPGEAFRPDDPLTLGDAVAAMDLLISWRAEPAS